MINSASETLISLADAAGELPRRRRGRKAHVSCLYRWSTAGCRGVVLESIQVGATRCTSREALQRFFERLSAPVQAGAAAGSESDPGPLSVIGPSPNVNGHQAEAGRKLAEMGA